MASNGLTMVQIAACSGISESTLYAKQGDYKVSNALFEKPTQVNVTAMIYFLRSDIGRAEEGTSLSH
jgi:hypothetical protein